MLIFQTPVSRESEERWRSGKAGKGKTVIVRDLVVVVFLKMTCFYCGKREEV